MRTKRTKRNRRKRSRRKLKRGGAWLPGFVADSARNVGYTFGNTMNAMGGKYQGVNPDPLSQPLVKSF